VWLLGKKSKVNCLRDANIERLVGMDVTPCQNMRECHVGVGVGVCGYVGVCGMDGRPCENMRECHACVYVYMGHGCKAFCIALLHTHIHTRTHVCTYIRVCVYR
jgi:hypothetical protein